MQSFVNPVLIQRLQLVHLPVRQRLLHRPTADMGMPAGWTAGTGARASSDAKEPAVDGSGSALRLHIGIDRFLSIWHGCEVTSAADGGGAEAKACDQAVRAVPQGRAEAVRAVWARVRAGLLH